MDYDGAKSIINSAVWLTICLVVVVVINFLGTQAFGECEFWFGEISAYSDL